jgi:hypothetical protein
MGIKLMNLATLMVLSFAFVNVNAQANKDYAYLSNQRALLHKYAFCKCLGYGFPKESLNSKDFSLTILMEQLEYPLSVYMKVDSIAKIFAESIQESNYQDTRGKKGVMVNCIDFYIGKKLDSLIKSFDPSLQKK